MLTNETADRVLHLIFEQAFVRVTTRWGETFGSTGSEEEVIARGLNELESILPTEQECVLHGWIDQAVLEIVSRGKLAELREKVANYRADQGGDTGVVALEGDTATVLEFSFEVGRATIQEYKLAEQVVAPNRSLAPSLNSTSSVRGSEDS